MLRRRLSAECRPWLQRSTLNSDEPDEVARSQVEIAKEDAGDVEAKPLKKVCSGGLE